MLRIVWDERKRQVNRAKHGLDFVDLDSGFFDDATVFEAHGDRLLAIGRSHGRWLAVIFVRLGREGLSVISMRPASPRERRLL